MLNAGVVRLFLASLELFFSIRVPQRCILSISLIIGDPNCSKFWPASLSLKRGFSSAKREKNEKKKNKRPLPQVT